MLATSSMGTIKRGMRRSAQQITRDRTWGTTLLLLAALMVLVQLFMIFLLGIHGVGRLLTARAAIQIEVLDTATEQDIQELYAELQAHPSVQSALFIPKEQAYDRQKARDPELVSFLEQYQLDNPFPDTFSVTLRSLDTYDEFVEVVQQSRWQSVVNPSFLSTASTHEREIRTLMQVTNGLQTLSIIFMVIAFILLFFVVLEWVSRTAVGRGHELLLEHLLGASSLTVMLPFAAEMTVLLLCSALIGTVIVIAFFLVLPFLMPAFALEAPFQLLQTEMRPLLLKVFPLLLLLEIIAMPILAYAGTVLGVRRKMPASFTLLS